MIKDLYRKLGPEVIRYIFSGIASGVSMYMTGLALNKIGVPALFASSIAALISFVVSYVLQKYWVFSARSVSTAKSVARFLLVTLFTWTIGLGWVWFADVIIQLAYEWSQLVLTVLVAVLNFTINKLWTFRPEGSNQGAQ